MDDATALRLKKIERTVQAAERSAGIETQLRIAVLAVGLTLGTSSAFAGLASTVAPMNGGAGLFLGTVLAVTRVRSMLAVRQRLGAAHERAIRNIVSLIGSGGELPDDGPSRA